jgi:hypothetical protein
MIGIAKHTEGYVFFDDKPDAPKATKLAVVSTNQHMGRREKKIIREGDREREIEKAFFDPLPREGWNITLTAPCISVVLFEEIAAALKDLKPLDPSEGWPPPEKK